MLRLVKLVISVGALLASIVITPSCMFFRDRFVDRELAGAVTLNQKWLELTPETPLTVERDTQEIMLYPDPPIKMVSGNAKSGLVSIDGRSADIDAELVDSNSVTYGSSPGATETMTGDLQVTSRSINFRNLPKGAVLKTVRIRSSASYPVNKILWRCYNWAEVHK
ncbi:MAG: hypothetical protein M3209_00740 [Acidobacteriota bacterium]|nr:hypothetical protein [Acidobacteriota bacterium]